MSAPARFLACDTISKIYGTPRGGQLEAIRGVTFEQAKGEVVALLGPSGCGKSTLLRIVAGLEKATVGNVSVAGERVVGPGRDRGMVFQSYTAFDWLTVRENVEFGLKLAGVPRSERRDEAERFIDFVQLTKFKDAYPAMLSGGMKQRLAIARTFANRPDVILMDEPFGALDSETRWIMQELLLSIVKRTNATVLIVTHDLGEAIFLADKIVFLEAYPGRVKEEIRVEIDRSDGLRREDLLEDGDYRRLSRHLMGIMRNAVSGDDLPA
jgi:NitT/TauT family transport system ATP-binding protein